MHDCPSNPQHWFKKEGQKIAIGSVGSTSKHLAPMRIMADNGIELKVAMDMFQYQEAATIVICVFLLVAEAPHQEISACYDTPPLMYSAEINYWLCDIALDLVQTRPEFKLIYIHTTDYPMHTWGPMKKSPMSISINWTR